MLQGHFYHTTSTDYQENAIQVILQLNPDHEIFKGHFPGQPVVPGACLLQMVKEILSNVLQSGLRLKKADNLKFIAPIDPVITPELKLKLTYKSVEQGLYVSASLSANEVVCFKMQGVFDR